MLKKIIVTITVLLFSSQLFAMFSKLRRTVQPASTVVSLQTIASSIQDQVGTEFAQTIQFTPDSIRALYPLLVVNKKNQDLKKQQSGQTITQQAQNSVLHAQQMLQALISLQNSGHINLSQLVTAVFPKDNFNIALVSMLTLLFDYQTVLEKAYTLRPEPENASGSTKERGLSTRTGGNNSGSQINNSPPSYDQSSLICRMNDLGLLNEEASEPDQLSRNVSHDIGELKRKLKIKFGTKLQDKIQAIIQHAHTSSRQEMRKYDDENVTLTFFNPRSDEFSAYLPEDPWDILKDEQSFMDYELCTKQLKKLCGFKSMTVLNKIAETFQSIICDHDLTKASDEGFVDSLKYRVECNNGLSDFTGADLLEVTAEYLKNAGVDSQKAKPLAGLLLTQAINQAAQAATDEKIKRELLGLLKQTFQSFEGDQVALYRLTGVISQAFTGSGSQKTAQRQPENGVYEEILEQAKEMLRSKLAVNEALRIARYQRVNDRDLDDQDDYYRRQRDSRGHVAKIINMCLERMGGSAANKVHKFLDACKRIGRNDIGDDIIDVMAQKNAIMYH